MKNFLIILLALPMLLIGCKQEEPLAYENAPGLYFYRDPGTLQRAGIQRDSLTFAFYTQFLAEGDQFEQKVKMNTVGMPEDRARSFRLVQSNAGQPDAAVAGVDYVALDDPSMVEKMVIPAGAVDYELPVTLIYTSGMGEKMKRLELQVVANDNFRPNVEDQSGLLIIFGDVATKPSSWVDGQNILSWYPYFENWSAEKMRWIAVSLGFADFDAEFESTNTGRKKYYQQVMYDLLQEYNNALPGTDNDMKDENGDFIVIEQPTA